ncbi:MAG: hypothetical protein U5K74_16485 [Gemmatimonadaceae bacterium]|nr:hypothetical protein [Gemmatimonadaceae bacterium]
MAYGNGDTAVIGLGVCSQSLAEAVSRRRWPSPRPRPRGAPRPVQGLRRASR